MGDYKQLLVWKQAHGLALEIYRATRLFPATSAMDWLFRCAGLLCLLYRTLQKVREGRVTESSPAFSALLEARCTKSNASCSCPGTLAIWHLTNGWF